jgi:uncharacterized membrane protein YfcA
MEPVLLNPLTLLFLMPLAAFLYASVGHGGASSYLMLLTLSGYAPEKIRPFALLLNLLVAGMAWNEYRKVAPLRWQRFWPFILLSVPAAWIGAGAMTDPSTFRFILGLVLLFPALRLLIKIPVSHEERFSFHPFSALIIGALIGFLSGMIGIGGGILLSPILLFTGWSGVKETATMSSLFIVINSVTGLAASWNAGKTIIASDNFMFLFIITLLAGLAGARLGALRFNTRALRRVLALVLLIASAKFIIG